MKSIMEEASSVSKAIEKAWARAQKPTSFSVKVLEESVKNFFGLTSKPAKIAFYFEESVVQAHKPNKQQAHGHKRTERSERPQERNVSPQSQRAHPEQPRRQTPQGQPQTQQNNRPARPVQEQKPIKKEVIQKSEIESTRQEMPEAVVASWPTHIKVEAEQWLNKAITALRSDAHIEYVVNKNELQVTVNCSLALNGNERMLCSSLAHLLMQALRNQFKNETRGLRIHIKTAALS